MYKIQTFRAGGISTNLYFLIDGGNAILIDAPPEPFEAVEFIKNNRLNLQAVLLTHTHYDHFLGIFDIWNEIDKNIPLYYHPAEEFIIQEGKMNGGAYHEKRNSFYRGKYNPLHEGNLQVGDFNLDVYHIPGHTPGGVAFCTKSYCFSGDSLFAGTIGRSDWGYSDGVALVENIKSKLLVLPDDTKVFPGHGYYSTIAEEKANNPFLR